MVLVCQGKTPSCVKPWLEELLGFWGDLGFDGNSLPSEIGLVWPISLRISEKSLSGIRVGIMVEIMVV